VNDILRIPKVQEHIRKAKDDGKCVQCQHPWYDGICSCGKYGDEEKAILEMVEPLLSANNREFEANLVLVLNKEIEKIDAGLKTEKELEGLWK